MSQALNWLRTILTGQLKPQDFAGMSAWFEHYQSLGCSAAGPFERAVLGGASSNCMGFASASGYQAAISALFGNGRFEGRRFENGRFEDGCIEKQQLSSLCVSEAGGNHPRAIETSLSGQQGELTITGQKSFISGAEDAQCMYVACKDLRDGDGLDAQGRPLIKLVRLATSEANVTIKKMTELKFLPEISHGTVRFDEVKVDESWVLPGDGYLQYVKPFRTYEDVFVLSSILAYRLREGLGNWDQTIIERHVELLMAMSQLSQSQLMLPQAHIALSACRRSMMQLIEDSDALFKASNLSAYEAWQRDKPLLKVAIKAHEKRTESAWNMIFNQE